MSASHRIGKNSRTINFLEHPWNIPRFSNLRKMPMHFWTYQYAGAEQLKKYTLNMKLNK